MCTSHLDGSALASDANATLLAIVMMRMVFGSPTGLQRDRTIARYSHGRQHEVADRAGFHRRSGENFGADTFPKKIR
jgi:hypothetical protein